MIGIVDYEIGNLRSVRRALERAGGDVRFVRTASQLAQVDKIVLPGVAAFGDAMDQLRVQGLVRPLIQAINEGTPYLGLCLGLQLLFELSCEGGQHAGMGIFGGQVVRFGSDAGFDVSRVPHMGWNQIHWDKPVGMLDGLDSGAYVYFAHSYYAVPTVKDVVATTTDYGLSFPSAIWRDNVFATQFHPEKSQAVGLRLLQNFVRM